MLEITYYGHSCFKIKGKNNQIIIDPYNPELFNLKSHSILANLILVTKRDSEYHNFTNLATSGNGQDPFVILGPGEYEIEGTVVVGVEAEAKEPEDSKDNKITIYQVSIDGLSIAHLGILGKKLSQNQLESLGNIDIAIVPVGAKYSIGSKEAVEIIAQLEPRIVIPSHYKLKQEQLELESLSDFFNQMGTKEASSLDKLTISYDKLPEELEVVHLKEAV